MNKDIQNLAEAYASMFSPISEKFEGLSPAELPRDIQWEVGNPVSKHQNLSTYADYNVEGYSASTDRTFTAIALYNDANDDISIISSVQEIK